MVVKSTLACGLQKSIGNLWKGDDFSDFTVVVEDTTFKCHRFILSACSSFFQGLFTSKLKERQEKKATVGGMTASTFDVILNSLYKGTDGLTEDNVLDVWSATVQLQIGYLAEECENYVMENMCVDSCFIVLSYATMYSAKRVVDHTLDFISKHFEQVEKRENFLQLSYDQFYKIIDKDYLATSSEDIVLEVVMKWVEYTSSLTQGSQTGDTNITSDANSSSRVNDSLEETEITSQSNIGMQSNSYDHKSSVSRVTEDREQHLFQLISSCRLYIINPKYLETLLTNNKQLRSCKQAYSLIFEAMMYGLNVERRHDAWPDLAVHRISSSMKHVMVFVYNEKCMLYNLNNGSVHEFVNLPKGFKANKTITVFDNNLYLDYVDKDGQVLSIFTTEKSWLYVNYSFIVKNGHSFMVAHGSCIYGLLGKKLHCCHIPGDVRQWSFCCELNQNGHCLVRFKHYIIVFYTENGVVTAQCYNTETKKLRVGTTTMDGTAKDLTSFSHQGDVFILQRNGSLWKIVSSDKEPVDFELISKLWDQEYNLRGCVVYRKQLFVFCLEDQGMKTITLWTSLPGIFNSIKMVAVKTDTPCLPMVVHLTCLQSISSNNELYSNDSSQNGHFMFTHGLC